MLIVILITGLINITHAMSTPATIVQFLPGHYETFDLKQSGKVQSIATEQFHCCTQEPAHAIYDTVETLSTSMQLFIVNVIEFIDLDGIKKAHLHRF